MTILDRLAEHARRRVAYEKEKVSMEEIRTMALAAGPAGGERFYDALEKAAEIYLDYARTDEAFFNANDDKFQHLLDTASNLGYGVRDDLEEMYFNAQAEVYGEEDDV